MSGISQEIQSIKQRFGIIGNSPALNHAIQVAMQVAPTDMTVLISGESGSGKESFSKIIHSLSTRKHGKFIAINCGAIPEGTIDSELFGHEKGSFTGAHEARKGYFEETNQGTIFLDEIGEMPLGTQARLLRVLENKEFIKVGSSKVLKTDVRVIAATNVNLLEAVQKGEFREDLYYRLNTVPITVPPLRERGNDIELLFRKFASDFADRYKVAPIRLSDEAKEVIVRYSFPGNIRQLKNIAEQISVLETDRLIGKEQLVKYLPALNTPVLPALKKGSSSSEDFSERELLYKILFDMKKDMNELKKLVYEVLKNENYGNQVLNNHKELFHSIQHNESTAEDIVQNNYLLKGKENTTQPIILSESLNDDEDVTDIEIEAEDESLSLNAKEKEMIIKALKKNNNKRKYAAQDLGISERTLYRKIKEYNLED
jgi:transcriptional regulator with PAS, ATPase and Fis domain